MTVEHLLPWWAWLFVAWLSADAVFVIAWTMRARLRERDALEARFPVEPSPRALAPLDELAPRPVATNRRSSSAR